MVLCLTCSLVYVKACETYVVTNYKKILTDATTQPPHNAEVEFNNVDCHFLLFSFGGRSTEFKHTLKLIIPINFT